MLANVATEALGTPSGLSERRLGGPRLGRQEALHEENAAA